MYNELKTREDTWMQSVHESIDRLSALIDAIPEGGANLPKDEYLCDKEVSRLLKVSRRTLSEYRGNGTLPYYILGGKVLYKWSEIEQVLRQGYGQDEGLRLILHFSEGVRFAACPISIKKKEQSI